MTAEGATARGGGNRGQRYSKEDRRRFFHLHFSEDGPGLSIVKAAEELQIPYSTLRNWAGKFDASVDFGRQKGLRDLPHPIPFDKLCDDAKYALEDFGLFRFQYFARHDQIWGEKAARVVLEAVADKSERSFVDMNVFPGSGKSTMLEDLVIWLICGGGIMDPAIGRALRVMVGARVMKLSRHITSNIKRNLERHRPYYDKITKERAPKSLTLDFGRFRPHKGYGEDATWREDQFLVAQVGEFEIYDREPTVQAAAQDSGFLGERVDLAIWDDLAVSDNSRGPEQQRALAQWFENEAETRVEPGGSLILVGQRISTHDLHRNRINKTITIDEAGTPRALYKHIMYPAHHDDLCQVSEEGELGTHRQWNGGTDGCMTDLARLPLSDWYIVKDKTDYRTVFQQQDIDPGLVLIEQAWIDGGEDSGGDQVPGCWDTERGWGEHPKGVPKLVDYVSIDPSVSGWWAIEWWSYCPSTGYNYLIWGIRQRMTAGKLLDWDNPKQEFVGHMEEIQQASVAAGHPVIVWILESNAAHKYLQQNMAFHRWRKRWPQIRVIAHETQRNKLDPEMGLTGLLPGKYRTGMKRLPGRRQHPPLDNKFIKNFVDEHTMYSLAEDAKNYGYDTVMSDWIGETNLNAVIMAGKRSNGQSPQSDAKVPKYLERRRREMGLGG